MKVGIVLSGNIESQPYVSYYTDVFDNIDIDYEYICWDREKVNPSVYNNHNVISIDVKGSVRNNNFRKLYDYWLFSKNVKNHLDKNHYDFLLIHTIVNGVFLKNYLIKYYKNKYIFDIRDYSPIYPFVKNTVEKIITQSLFTSVSSEGFLKWLPNKSKVVISHNVSKYSLDVSLLNNNGLLNNNDSITILTIGKIRDFYSNKRVINDLGNKQGIKMIFSGSGIESEKLETFSLNNYNNILFTGPYEKKDESTFVKSSNMLNIVLPKNILSTSLISNRFYLALTHRKLMIVNEESFQATFIKKYNLGIIVKSEDDIYVKMMEYIKDFDYNSFDKGCDDLIGIIKKDIVIFENTIKEKLS
ncbi:hypothetical protein [Flavobacterium sp. K5-23]|uniref:hypothetical protein n=1 Tax=Flavobacterium sp. K5-23 TaxID=2746225 RepID=UPI00200E89D8|nr:hypothetical protein [Flavobacterium sp. K5-23]UQD56125.1 hypothetical protein FLAK523_06860 [Flavobacterium sp. K5-23]